jgi:carbonic anhydrase/acetyltransferase-like protein (isoleucine patch superfamily)
VIRAFQGRLPVVPDSAFVVDSADVIGDVTLGEGVSVWFQAVVRGDVNTIRIGDRTNVQDGCVLHVQSGGPEGALSIGSDVTLGHGAIVHGCTVADHCLVGMGAIVLDNARINPYTLVAAGAVVRAGATFPGGVLVAGVPAKVMRELSSDERTMIDQSALHYVETARAYREH